MFLECILLYSDVADLAFFNNSFWWLKLMSRPLPANLMVRMLESVPFGSKVGLNAVLFFLTIENNLSSSALECESTKINFDMDDNLLKHGEPSGSFLYSISCPFGDSVCHHQHGLRLYPIFLRHLFLLE